MGHPGKIRNGVCERAELLFTRTQFPLNPGPFNRFPAAICNSSDKLNFVRAPVPRQCLMNSEPCNETALS